MYLSKAVMPLIVLTVSPSLKWEQKMAAVVKEKEEMVKDREEKIQRLKKQIAEAFTGNSA